jgi:hypothetical protein
MACLRAAVALAIVLAAEVAWGAEAVPPPAPRIAEGGWAPALKSHPRLLGPREFLQAQAKAKPDVYKLIRTDPSLKAVAITHAVEGVPRERIEPFIAAARKHVAAGVTNVHQDTHLALTQVALTYDLFFDAISPGDRQAMIAWMNAHLEKYTTDESAFHNSTLSKTQTYLQIAYGTMGENPRAGAFRDYAIKKLYEGLVLQAILEFGAGGGYTECGWYTRGSLWNLVQALEMARRFEPYDGFAKAPRFFYQRLAYEMYQPYPGFGECGAEHYSCEGDGSYVYGGHTEYPRHTRTVLAQYFRGSALAGYVMNRCRKGSSFDARLVDFLYEEDRQPALDLAGLPLAHVAAGIGKVYARSDWTDDATWLRFECGDYWNAHQHFEVGNFEIFRYDELAAESGEYHDWGSPHAMNWLIRTVAHNCILIYQPGETWPRMRDGGQVRYANDGGQAMKWVWPVATLAEWKAKRATFERGDLAAYDNHPEYLFVAGDCTAAYAPAKLSSWVRQIVFVRPATFVVFDRVVTAKPEFEKTWLLHMRNEPQIRGTSAAIANGKGRLAVETLLPQEAVIRKVEGYTYRGQTFDPPRSYLSAKANKWRIEVLPPAPRTEDLFLHVLQTDQPQAVSLVRKGDAVGAKVGAAEVLFTGPVGGTLTTGGKTLPLKRGVVTGKYE